MASRCSRRIARGLILFTLTTAAAFEADATRGKEGACERVADSQLSACKAGAFDDYFVARAICRNGSLADKSVCIDEVRDERADALGLCREQLASREMLCDELGGGRYAPDFDPVTSTTTSPTSRIRIHTSRFAWDTSGATRVPMRRSRSKCSTRPSSSRASRASW